MANFTITPETSVFDIGFSDGTADADQLTVQEGATLNAPNATGALLDSDGAWKVVNHGTILATSGTGLWLLPGNQDTSTVTIGAEGNVGGNLAILAESPADIKNSGVIAGLFTGIELWGGSSIDNKGTLSGGITSIRDNLGTGDDVVKNSGVISGLVILEAGDNSITNTKTGVIESAIATTFGDDSFTNSGTTIDVLLGAGENTVVNKGTGTINGNLTLGSDVDTVSNKANATITGDLATLGGDDTVTNKGWIHGTVDLGSGDDTYRGGTKSETVMDGDGTDDVKLSGGDDTYIATGATGTDGPDDIDGGSGTDHYDASAATIRVIINLSSDTQDDAGGTFWSISAISANTALGTDIADGTSDTITKFENASGGAGGDIIFGSNGDNVLMGNAGVDDLYGRDGDDRLDGGAGGDFLVGGAGADVLFGGGDADTFWFFNLSDSGTTKATRDLIEDFEDDGAAGELIDLSAIDADTSTGVNDAFNFIGTNVAFTDTAGELRARWTATGQIVEGDVDGNGRADFSFEIADASHAITLSALNNDDFVL